MTLRRADDEGPFPGGSPRRRISSSNCQLIFRNQCEAAEVVAMSARPPAPCSSPRGERTGAPWGETSPRLIPHETHTPPTQPMKGKADI